MKLEINLRKFNADFKEEQKNISQKLLQFLNNKTD